MRWHLCVILICLPWWSVLLNMFYILKHLCNLFWKISITYPFINQIIYFWCWFICLPYASWTLISCQMNSVKYSLIIVQLSLNCLLLWRYSSTGLWFLPYAFERLSKILTTCKYFKVFLLFFSSSFGFLFCTLIFDIFWIDLHMWW